MTRRTKAAPEAPADPLKLGAEAKRLLDDPVLALALARIQAKLMATWRNSTLGGAEEREAAYRLNWAVEQLKTELRLMVGKAKVIEAETAAPTARP